MKNKTFHKRKILVVFAGAAFSIMSFNNGICRSLCDDICFDRKTDLSYGI